MWVEVFNGSLILLTLWLVTSQLRDTMKGAVMGHKNKKSLYIQMCERLEKLFTPGRSKHEDKRNSGTTGRIYSYSTLEAYKKHAGYFLKYCRSVHRCRALDECRPYIREWLATRAGLSAYTVKLEAAAIGKLYGISTTDIATFGRTAPRRRSDIRRSRKPAKRDKHFNESKHADIVAFCKATGLRRRELEHLTGDCLIQTENAVYIHIANGKGGKVRNVEIYDDHDKAMIIEIMNRAGSGLVFPCVPSCMDVHGYRREYATRLYNRFARSLEECKRARFWNAESGRYESSLYRCRCDKAGKWYDKKAMLIVSRALGHNRISVIAGHYLDD